MSPSTIFGAPLGYTPDLLTRWIRDLEKCWVAFADQRPSTLDADIERLAEVYANGVRGATLREAVARVDPTIEYSVEIQPEIAIHADGAYLITPEGRILLDTLLKLQRAGAHVVDPETAATALAYAVKVRSEWFAEWAGDQLKGNLSPAVIAAALLLAVNGSVGEGHPFILRSDDPNAQAIRDVVIGIIGGFSKELGGKETKAGDLRSHWVFTQVTRLLSSDIARVSRKQEKRSLLYIRPGREDHLIATLRDNLKEHRPDDVRRAVQGLIDGYRTNRGLFVAMKVMNEQPAKTERILAAMQMKPAR